MPKVYLSIGTNIGDRFKNLQTAINKLAAAYKIVYVSKIYETQPVGDVIQDDFYNIVVALAVSDTVVATAFLTQTQSIEQEMKRVKTIHWGPRTIDLDILLFGDVKMTTDTLKIPHPEMANRLFVLQPLLEVATAVQDGQVSSLITQLLADTVDRNWVRPVADEISY